jgi:hypothetical protein
MPIKLAPFLYQNHTLLSGLDTGIELAIPAHKAAPYAGFLPTSTIPVYHVQSAMTIYLDTEKGYIFGYIPGEAGLDAQADAAI